MTKFMTQSGVLFLLLLLGCSQSSIPAVGYEAVGVDLPPGTAPTYAGSAFEACIEESGGLSVVDTIDNNDTREHGEILAFDVSDSRRLAISTADGFLKFWSLDGFEGEVGLAQLTYGPEILANVSQVAFLEDRAVTGDNMGVVAAWSPEEPMRVLSGTEPGTPIDALAVDETLGRLAHGDVARGLVVRPLPDSVGEAAFDETLSPRALAFLGDSLVVADGSTLQVRDAITLELLAENSTGATTLDTSGGRIVAGDGVRVFEFDASLGALGEPATPSAPLVDVASIAGFRASLSEAGVELFGAEGRSLAYLELADGVGLVGDPDGELLFVATRFGNVHLVACVR